jgi:hypothetical protein
MTEIEREAESLRRPNILIRAARAGTRGYNRNRDLRRLLRCEPPTPAVALRRLIDAEGVVEMRRRTGDAGYSLTRHVELLIALIAEIGLLRGNPSLRP